MMNAATNLIENLMRKDDAHAEVVFDIAIPANSPARFVDPSGEKMRALIWQGKYGVRMSDSLKPRLINNQDVIVKLTGSNICCTDLHL